MGTPFRLFELKHICDQCGKPRCTGKHDKCSKRRQAEKQKQREQQ